MIPLKKVEIDKTKILVKNNNKKLSLALFELDEEEIMEFPFTNTEILDLVNEKNNADIVEKAISFIDLTAENIKDFISCFNILSNPENVMICSKGTNIKFKSEDYTGNNFEYNLESRNESSGFESKYDMNLIKNLYLTF